MLAKTAKKDDDESPTEVINGLRMTRQRREIYKLLLEKRVHPTAQDVFIEIKDRLPQISLATVYNCLEALSNHGLVKQVHFDRESCRYCPNLQEHGHFYDLASNSIHDITFKPGVNLSDFLELPPGAQVSHIDLSIRGTIA